MATAQLSQRPFLVLAGAIILHVILISAQVNTRSGIPLLQAATFGVFAELQRATTKSISSVRSLWSGYVDLRSVQAENESLKRELQTLQVRLQEERAFAQRTESLRQLLELRQRAELQTVASEIIAAGPDTEFKTLTLDKGSSDGIRRDMAVIAATGVVGRVILPSARAAQVQLLIDQNAAAGAMIERTRAQGVVRGQGSDTYVMDYVPGTADVKPGDLVVTSGIDRIYPKGFVIGTVDVVDRGPGTFHKIIVRPSVDFSRLEDVLVVTTPPPALAAEKEPVSSRPPGQVKPSAANQTPPRPVNLPAARPANRTPSTPAEASPGPPAQPARPPGRNQSPSGNQTPPGNQSPPGNQTPLAPVQGPPQPRGMAG